MFRYKFYSFLNTNYCLIIQISSTKILIGSFFDEDSLMNLNPISKNNNYPFNDNEIENINEIFNELNIIITPQFSFMFSLPYIINKFKINTESIKFYTTEAISQLSLSYLIEFYINFNSLLIQNTISYEQTNLITEKQIKIFLSNYTYMNYNQIENYLIKNLEKGIQISFHSNGYELGSFNTLIKYFNKKIIIINKSSLYNFRYPKLFDYDSIINCNYLIPFPDICNTNSNYKFNLENFTQEMRNAGMKNIDNLNHYPSLFLIVEPLFILEFVDLMRYKFSKDIKYFYLSKSIDSIMKYANINTGFINSQVFGKIFEFLLPFSFDELEKQKVFYHFQDFNELKDNKEIGKFIQEIKCPFCFIINKFSFFTDLGNDIFEFFTRNFSSSKDEIIAINSNNLIEKKILDHKKNIEFKEFNIEYFITNDQFKEIINKIKPKKIIEPQINILFDEKFTDDIIYENAYLDFDCNEIKEINVNVIQKNLRFIISKNNQESIDNDNDNLTDDINKKFEKILQKYLKMNNMIISKSIFNENSIELVIKKNNIESQVEIIMNDKTTPNINITCENYEDSLFLNTILSHIFI